MKGSKTFDCVEMKEKIQAQMLEEEAGMTFEEVTAMRRARIEEDPILGPWLKDIRVVGGDEREAAPVAPTRACPRP